jgi:hypothetical protein
MGAELIPDAEIKKARDFVSGSATLLTIAKILDYYERNT